MQLVFNTSHMVQNIADCLIHLNRRKRYDRDHAWDTARWLSSTLPILNDFRGKPVAVV